MSNEWRDEQNRCLREIERHQQADQSYVDEGVQLLELARNAQKLFEQQEPREKRRLLNFVLSNCTWEDGGVVATFRQPFDLLAETAVSAARAAASERPELAKTEIWLGWEDSNLQMSVWRSGRNVGRILIGLRNMLGPETLPARAV
jgi:site-specific DNA recombinase